MPTNEVGTLSWKIKWVFFFQHLLYNKLARTGCQSESSQRFRLLPEWWNLMVTITPVNLIKQSSVNIHAGNYQNNGVGEGTSIRARKAFKTILNGRLRIHSWQHFSILRINTSPSILTDRQYKWNSYVILANLDFPSSVILNFRKLVKMWEPCEWSIVYLLKNQYFTC